MHLENTFNNNESSLPYQPIKYVYTETIGSLTNKFNQIIDPYTWAHQDILQPKPLYNISKVDYYLFHVAPIYNWLRNVGSSTLAKYLQKDNHNKITLSPHNSKNLVHKNLELSYGNKEVFKNFEAKFFFSQLKHYISQWQIVKLSACAKIRIITTRIQPNRDQQKSKIKKNDNKIVCGHLIKKQRFSSSYQLYDKQQQKIRLECTKQYCQQCDKQITIKAEIVKYPFAPYFLKFYGKEFTLNCGNAKKIDYQLIIVYCQQKSYVKSSAGVWYEVDKHKANIVSFQKLELKNGLVFVYQQKVTVINLLKRAEPLIASSYISTSHKNQQNNQFNDDSSEEQLPKLKKNQSSHQLNLPVEIPLNQLLEEANQPLEQMSKAPLPIIMSKKKTDRRLFKEYKKTVEQLLPKPKQKDEYQKEYDKGKTKKIHKNKQIFRTADFFQLYNKIKTNNPATKDSFEKLQDGSISNQESRNANQLHESSKNEDKKRQQQFNDSHYKSKQKTNKSHNFFKGENRLNQLNKSTNNPKARQFNKKKGGFKQNKKTFYQKKQP